MKVVLSMINRRKDKSAMLNKLVLRVSVLIFACLLSNVSSGVQTSFYISPEGDDSNSGTEGSPFQTVAAAQDAVLLLLGILLKDWK